MESRKKKIAIQKGNLYKGTPYITVIGDGGWAKRNYGHGFNSQSGVKKTVVFAKNQRSTGMEQDIIVEGFRQSLEQHDVIKLECANHITRNLHDGLRKLVANKHFPLHVHKVLTYGSPSPLERLVKGVRTAIKECGKSHNVNILREDLKNAPFHVLGSHKNCHPTYCTWSNMNEKDNVPLMESGKIMSEILAIVDKVTRKADRLVFNTTTNIAENFMNLVAKFTGGKRSWHLSPWKKLSGKSPGKFFKKNLTRRIAMTTLNSKYKKQKKNRFKVSGGDKSTVNHDFDYGPDAAGLDMTEEDFKFNVNKKLEELKKILFQPKQSNNYKKTLLVNMIIKSTTSCHNLVKTLLYSKNIISKHIEFERQNEKVVIRQFENQYNKTVRPCGLFVDEQYPFLGASPDGLVDDDKIIEVKCTPSIGQKTLEDAAIDKKLQFCLELTETGQLKLKENYKYYWQIQGQLNITKKIECIFILFSMGNNLYVQNINRDEYLWTNKMLPKLINFYMDCMLPEIVDPRVPRGLRIRDPAKITEAQFQIKKKFKNL
ncbi:YqaJ domain-containing protein, partial [Aphis craccivora]